MASDEAPVTDATHRLRAATRPCAFCDARVVDVANLVAHLAETHIDLFPGMREFYDLLLPRIKGKSNAQTRTLMAEVAKEMGIEEITQDEFDAKADDRRRAIDRQASRLGRSDRFPA